MAEVGKAPVKLVLSQPRDRIQWVNALRADPLPYLAAEPMPDTMAPVRTALAARDLPAARAALAQARSSGAPAAWLAVMDAAIALQAGDLLAAREQLARQVAQPAAPLPAWLMQSDVQLVEGEGTAAADTLRTALQRWPAHPALTAQLARVLMLSDRVDEASAALAPVQATAHAEVALVRAELARRQGDAPATLAAYTEATQLAAGDARAWQGLGSAHTEREDAAPRPRQSAAGALALSPQQPRRLGRTGHAGNLHQPVHRRRCQAFATALGDNPADYVALTGQGLLHLKQGDPQAALDAFLRAGVMEPRYARAKTWTAVAYYQLGRHQDALATLRQASSAGRQGPRALHAAGTDPHRPVPARRSRGGCARSGATHALPQVAQPGRQRPERQRQPGCLHWPSLAWKTGRWNWRSRASIRTGAEATCSWRTGMRESSTRTRRCSRVSSQTRWRLVRASAIRRCCRQPGAPWGGGGDAGQGGCYKVACSPAITLNGMNNSYVPTVLVLQSAVGEGVSELPFEVCVNNQASRRCGAVMAMLTVARSMLPPCRCWHAAYGAHQSLLRYR